MRPAQAAPLATPEPQDLRRRPPSGARPLLSLPSPALLRRDPRAPLGPARPGPGPTSLFVGPAAQAHPAPPCAPGPAPAPPRRRLRAGGRRAWGSPRAGSGGGGFLAPAEELPHEARRLCRGTARGPGSQDVSGASGRAAARGRCGAAGRGGSDVGALAGQPGGCGSTAELGVPPPPSSGRGAALPARNATIWNIYGRGRRQPVLGKHSLYVSPLGHLLPGGRRPELRTGGLLRLPLPFLAWPAVAGDCLWLSGTCKADRDPCGVNRPWEAGDSDPSSAPTVKWPLRDGLVRARMTLDPSPDSRIPEPLCTLEEVPRRGGGVRCSEHVGGVYVCMCDVWARVRVGEDAGTFIYGCVRAAEVCGAGLCLLGPTRRVSSEWGFGECGL